MGINPEFVVGSICSGIEAASVAAPDNWQFAFFSEIDPFPSAVLKKLYPNIPNLGDFRNIKADLYNHVNLLCGGPPCQSFSIAGKRGGLDDDRGNLTLDYVRLAHELSDRGSLRWGLYENVPGILSDKTNAFGCLLSGLIGGDAPLCPPVAEWGENKDDEGGGDGTYGWQSIRWPRQGMASGPRSRVAWRVFDAQYFGLAQRRERVFVVISFDPRCDPAKVLFEQKDGSGDIAPRERKREEIAGDLVPCPPEHDKEIEYPIAPKKVCGTISDGAHNGGGNNGQDAYSGRILPVVIDRAAFNQGKNAKYDPKIEHSETMPTLVARGPHAVAFDMRGRDGGADMEGPHDTASIRAASGGSSKSYIVEKTISFYSKGDGSDACEEIAPTIRAGGFDKSHANAGAPPAICFKPSHYTRDKDGAPSEIYPPLTADADKGYQEAIIAQPVQPMAFTQNSRDEVRLLGGDGQTAGALAAQEGMKQRTYVADPTYDITGFHYAIRRLTPEECEILMGFPVGYTRIDRTSPNTVLKLDDDMIAYAQRLGFDTDDDSVIREFMCPDGPRYKALGNSWPVPVVRWIFSRIEDQEAALRIAV